MFLGYAELGKAAATAIRDTALSPITSAKLSLERTTTTVFRRLEIHEALLHSPRFIAYERVAFESIVVATESDRILLDFAKLKRLYDRVMAVRELVKAVGKDHSIGKSCYEWWNNWSNLVPWKTALPDIPGS